MSKKSNKYISFSNKQKSIFKELFLAPIYWLLFTAYLLFLLMCFDRDIRYPIIYNEYDYSILYKLIPISIIYYIVSFFYKKKIVTVCLVILSIVFLMLINDIPTYNNAGVRYLYFYRMMIGINILVFWLKK